MKASQKVVGLSKIYRFEGGNGEGVTLSKEGQGLRWFHLRRYGKTKEEVLTKSFKVRSRGEGRQGRGGDHLGKFGTNEEKPRNTTLRKPWHFFSLQRLKDRSHRCRKPCLRIGLFTSMLG